MLAIGTPTRHVDKGVLLASFAQEALAVCPKCSGPALVQSKSSNVWSFSPLKARARCLKCAFQKDGQDSSWLGPATGVAKERCPNCGYKWLQRICRSRSIGNQLRKWTAITCPACETVSKTSIEWRINRLGKPTDPAFGLPLWLQSSCCGETLWAYNAAHLEALHNYVAADLREDVNLHWSMFARLPKWISAHKNRATVLAGIRRLEKRLVSYT